MHTAETAVDLHRPLLAAHATGNVHSSGNARLLDGQLAVNSPEPRLALALPHARVARAGDIADGNLILAAVCAQGTDYFNTPYSAHPEPFDPSCGCGVCCPITAPGEVVVRCSELVVQLAHATGLRPPRVTRLLAQFTDGCPAARGAGGGRSTAGRAVIDLTE
ncbi:hypothetical protein ACFVZL_40740 [Streptomyces sp. NPDC058320]